MGFAGNYNDGTYHHAGFFRDASDAGTWKVFENYGLEPDASVYINTSHPSFRLAPFSAQNIRVTRNLTVVANSSLGNTSVSGFLRINGADVAATFAQNTVVQLAIANTNAYIATKADWSALTATNTAIRNLVSDRLQVANAEAKFATKAYAASNTYVNSRFQKTFNITGDFSSPVIGTARFVPISNVAISKVQLTNSTEVAEDLIITLYKNNIVLRTFTLPSGSFTRSYANTFSITTNDYLTVDVTSGSGSNFTMTLAS
jgi:hypothetical protein